MIEFALHAIPALAETTLLTMIVLLLALIALLMFRPVRFVLGWAIVGFGLYCGVMFVMAPQHFSF